MVVMVSDVDEVVKVSVPLPNGGQPQDTALLFRVSALEQQLKLVQEQLHNYVPTREHELQLTGIQGTVTRIERDVIDIKAKVEAQEREAREREIAAQKAQDALQIKALWFVVSTIISIVVIVVAGYATHLLR